MADVLFFGAHPDDTEILAGGLVASLAAKGHGVVLIDATRGEAASRGTPEERDVEAQDAARILGVAGRENLRLPDGALGHDLPRAVEAVVRSIRQHRPRLVVTHEPGDHHPDHSALAEAVKQAIFFAYNVKYDTGQPRHRVGQRLSMVGRRNELPERISFIADVSEAWERKMAALRAYTSQLHNPAYKGEETFISSEAAWRLIEARGAYFGSLIGTRYGEAFRADGELRVDDPLALMAP